MFYHIKGVLEDVGKDFAIIDNNGIGIKVYISAATMEKLPGTGQIIKLYTHFHVREDIMALYGFPSREELDMFELLISVSGVGPKAGLSVLSMLTPVKLGLSIMGNDIKSLTAVPGIGSKTAHRIILELKDKIDKDSILEGDSGLIISAVDNVQSEAVHALIALGYSANEASSAVRKAGPEEKDTEKIIKAALRILMK